MIVIKVITPIAIPRFSHSVAVWPAAFMTFDAKTMHPAAVIISNGQLTDWKQKRFNGKSLPVNPRAMAWTAKTTVISSLGFLYAASR